MKFHVQYIDRILENLFGGCAIRGDSKVLSCHLAQQGGISVCLMFFNLNAELLFTLVSRYVQSLKLKATGDDLYLGRY